MDEPHSEDKSEWDLATTVPHIHFEAELVTADQNVLIPVLQGYVDHVSIGAKASAYCAECGKPTRPIKVCDCNTYDILKDIIVEEYSIITNPAYKNAEFMTFTSAVNKYLEGENLENETPETTEIKEVIPDVEAKVETEVEITTDDKAEVKAEVESEVKTEIKPEVTTEVEAEVKTKIEEEPKKEEASIKGDEPKTDFVVNVNQDNIEDPGIGKMRSKEDDKMPEEKTKKDEVEASEVVEPTYNAEDISGLMGSVKELVSLLTQLNTEAASEEEDEDKKVEANDGNLTIDHSQDAGNPPKVDGPAPAAPKSYSEPEAPKTDVLPVTTPAFASKGVSAGLVGAVGSQMDNEKASLEEVLKYAASKGVVPR